MIIELPGLNGSIKELVQEDNPIMKVRNFVSTEEILNEIVIKTIDHNAWITNSHR